MLRATNWPGLVWVDAVVVVFCCYQNVVLLAYAPFHSSVMVPGIFTSIGLFFHRQCHSVVMPGCFWRPIARNNDPFPAVITGIGKLIAFCEGKFKLEFPIKFMAHSRTHLNGHVFV